MRVDATQADPAPSAASRRLSVVARCAALTTAILMLLTWRLWFDTGGIPQVPLLGVMRTTPAWLERLAAAALLTTLFLVGVVPRLRNSPRDWSTHRGLWGGVLVLLLVLQLANQHRLQPWAYHALLTAVVLACAAERRQLAWFRAVMISVYFYSALGKFDATFLTGLGSQMIEAALQTVGVESAGWPLPTRRAVAAILPAGELLVAILLVARRTRIAGVAAGIALHALLILLLSPWKLNHRPPVLVWNLGFAVQLVALFASWPRGERVASSDDMNVSTSRRWPARLAESLASVALFAAILLPLGEPWGWWDHWLSWGLYAPRASRAELWVAPLEVPNLPESVRPWVEGAGDDDLGDDDMADDEASALHGWRRVRLDLWSLDALNVPLYPQDRFQLGVATAVIEAADLDDRDATVVLWSMADRWQGARRDVQLRGRDELAAAARRFLFNASPAPGWSGVAGRP